MHHNPAGHAAGGSAEVSLNAAQIIDHAPVRSSRAAESFAEQAQARRMIGGFAEAKRRSLPCRRSRPINQKLILAGQNAPIHCRPLRGNRHVRVTCRSQGRSHPPARADKAGMRLARRIVCDDRSERPILDKCSVFARVSAGSGRLTGRPRRFCCLPATLPHSGSYQRPKSAGVETVVKSAFPSVERRRQARRSDAPGFAIFPARNANSTATRDRTIRPGDQLEQVSVGIVKIEAAGRRKDD
jgi:hypothetical protein